MLFRSPLPDLEVADNPSPFTGVCLQGINYFITQAGWHGYNQFLRDSKNIEPAAYRRFFEQQMLDFVQENKQSVQSCE